MRFSNTSWYAKQMNARRLKKTFTYDRRVADAGVDVTKSPESVFVSMRDARDSFRAQTSSQKDRRHAKEGQ